MPLVIVWLVLMPAGLFYLLIWRPQQRRMVAIRRLQAELSEGDDVLTTSGIYGRITKLGDTDADLEIAPGTVIHVARGAIGQRLAPDDVPDAGGSHDRETGAD